MAVRFEEVRLPVQATPLRFQAMRLPIQETESPVEKIHAPGR
jgi:hypothetical protein